MRRIASAVLVLLALVCLWQAWASYGIQGAVFDREPASPARAGEDDAGLGVVGVIWLIGGVSLLATAGALVRRRRPPRSPR